jgi:hypothetical protein
MHSSDPADSLHFAGNFAGLHYTGTTRFGVDWGPDRIRGTTDDIVYNSGNGATLVDEIVYVGVGNAYWPRLLRGSRIRSTTCWQMPRLHSAPPMESSISLAGSIAAVPA